MRKEHSEFRVATMTFHMAKNYGAMLQAYALQKSIESIGASCEVLDYRLPYIYDREGIPTYAEFVREAGFLRGNARYLIRHFNGWYRTLPAARRKFDRFMREDLKLSERAIFDKAELRKTKYDAVVFGSDQIWSPFHTGGFAPEYLGEYFDPDQTALISYAASCGKDHLDPDYRDAFLERLRRFSAVSVRKKSLAQYLNEECGISAQAVLDPVLLADPAIWEPLAEQGEIRIKEPYLLIYSFGAGDDIYKLAKKVAEERHLKPVAICYQKNPALKGIEQIDYAGPKDFLYLLKHADFVCTTSFHGLAFSMLFEKNYYCIGHPRFSQRERDLSDSMGLMDRYVEDWTAMRNSTDCDFTDAREKLACAREESRRFLENALRAAAGRKGGNTEGEAAAEAARKTPQLFHTPYECCGCTACASVCPVKAIRMEPDREGFLYPQVDEKLCIGCGACARVCQLKTGQDKDKPLAIFAAKNKDEKTRLASSSGGAFSLLAEYTESQGGVIYGAAFDETMRVCHKRAEKREEWEAFRTSKYVQSDIGDCYTRVKQDLANGRKVLFTGTPCQVEGLNRFLDKTNTENLLTCDVICHGAPSPLIWREWLGLIEHSKGKVFSVNFREKERTGWHKSSLTVSGENGKVLLSGNHGENSFSLMYFRHLIIRPACHQCHYDSFHRPGDITIGDYWGIERQFPDYDDDKGVSLVFCNSEKGQRVWNRVSDQTDCFSVEPKQCEQPSLLQQTEEAKGRAAFWHLHDRFGLTAAMKLFRFVPAANSVEKFVIKGYRALLRFGGKL